MANRKQLEAAIVQAHADQDQAALDALMEEVNKQDGYVAPEKPSTLAEYGKSLVSAAARPIINAVTAVPNMAQDAGVYLRNKADQGMNAVAPDLMQKVYGANKKIIAATGNNAVVDALLPTEPRGDHELPSQDYQRAVDATFTPPATTAGKIGEFINSGIVGGRLPTPSGLKGAPAAYQTAKEAETAAKMHVLRQSQALGAAVPPTTVKPTFTNRILESFGGKVATAQQAASNNATNFTNPLARSAINAPDNAVLDKGTLDLLKDHAGLAYDSVRNAGRFTAPKSYMQKLDALEADATKALKSFPEIGKSLGIDDMTSALNMARGNAVGIKNARPILSADDTISAIKLLRQRSLDAYAGDKRTLGKTYKAIATAMEDAVEEGLAQKGQAGAKLLADFKASRTQIAKIFSIAESNNPVTGDVSAKALGTQMKGGAPLTGELAAAARFGIAFPREGRLLNESIGVNQLTPNMAAVGAANSGEKTGLLGFGIPVIGQYARDFMLSRTGQRILTSDKGTLGRALENPTTSPNTAYGLERILGELPKKKKDDEE